MEFTDLEHCARQKFAEFYYVCSAVPCAAQNHIVLSENPKLQAYLEQLIKDWCELTEQIMSLTLTFIWCYSETPSIFSTT